MDLAEVEGVEDGWLTALSRHRILIVDDDPEIREALCDLLIEEGYEVALAENGEQALNAIRRHRPEMVLLDLMMPKVNGWELLGQLEGDDLPVILISAYPDVAWSVQDPRVRACFSKPIDTHGLLSTLRASP